MKHYRVKVKNVNGAGVTKFFTGSLFYLFVKLNTSEIDFLKIPTLKIVFLS